MAAGFDPACCVVDLVMVVDPTWGCRVLSVVNHEREEILMTYEMPAIADTVDLEGNLRSKSFSVRECIQCPAD